MQLMIIKLLVVSKKFNLSRYKDENLKVAHGKPFDGRFITIGSQSKVSKQ